MEPFRIEPEMAGLLKNMSDEELRSFVELQQDPTNDTETELFIYASLLISSRLNCIGFIEQAHGQANQWVAVTPVGHTDRDRRFKILDFLLAGMLQQREGLELVRQR